MAKSNTSKPTPLVPMKVRSAGFSIVRSPLLSRGAFAPSAPSGPETLEKRTAELFDFVKTNPVWAALKTTSPSLARAIDAPRKGEERAGIASAVMRYVERMRGRATPFGLCAGYGIVTSDKESKLPIRFAPSQGYEAILRIDVDAAMTAVKTIVVDAREMRSEFRWVATRELLLVGDTAKVTRRGSDGAVSYADVERNAALDVVLAATRTPATWAECLAAIGEFGSNDEERAGYIHRLIDEGILVPEAYPAISTDNELAPLARIPNAGLMSTVELARKHRFGPIGPGLLDAADELEAAFGRYKAAAEETAAKAEAAKGEGPNGAEDEKPSKGDKANGEEEKRDPACIFDLMKPVESGALGDDVFREVGRISAVLERFMHRATDPRHLAFSRFLLERYEGREVPLVEALDPDYGYHFPTDTFGLTWEVDEEASQKLANWRLALYTKAIASGVTEIVLQEQDLPAGPKESIAPVTGTFALHTRLGFDGGAPVFTYPQIVNSPGTLYFGRASGVSETIRKHATDLLTHQAEILKDIDIAHLSYFLPGKSAAFVQFPVLSKSEVVLAARAGSEREADLIDVNDILVSSDGRIPILRSQKTGRRIVVMSTGAANPNRPVVTGLARFLMTMHRDAFNGGFSWGTLAEMPFLPRVKFEKHTLAPARWRLSEEQTAPLRDAKTPAARWEAVQKLRAELKLPRNITFSEHSDHLLPVDLDDVLSVEAWLSIAQKTMSIVEQLGEDAIIGPEGAFQHELVLPVYTQPNQEALKAYTDGGAYRYQAYNVKDNFDTVLPGGDCLYLRIYGGRSELLMVMCGELATLITEAHAAKRCTHWFFLPFQDPDPHMRVRIFGKPEEIFGRILPEIREVLNTALQARIVRKVEISTYEREAYRYGGAESMDLCEQIFCCSSEAALEHHANFEGDNASAADMLVPYVASLRALAALTGKSLEAQRTLFSSTGDQYTRTLDRMLPKRAAGDLFRSLKPKLLYPKADVIPPATAARLKELFGQLEAFSKNGTMKRALDPILTDILHVHSIRILTTWCEVPNLEAIAYFVCEKTIAAELALAKKDREA